MTGPPASPLGGHEVALHVRGDEVRVVTGDMWSTPGMTTSSARGRISARRRPTPSGLIGSASLQTSSVGAVTVGSLAERSGAR